MADEKEEVVILPAVDGDEVEVGDEVDDVERQPADAEYNDHGDEHPIGALKLHLF